MGNYLFPERIREVNDYLDVMIGEWRKVRLAKADGGYVFLIKDHRVKGTRVERVIKPGSVLQCRALADLDLDQWLTAADNAIRREH